MIEDSPKMLMGEEKLSEKELKAIMEKIRKYPFAMYVVYELVSSGMKPEEIAFVELCRQQ